MPYIPTEVVARAREMDLLTYLKNYEPGELVHFGGNTYCTREHDSLKISNGKWCWFSRGIGGRTALDYLIKVKELTFIEAVERIVGYSAVQPPVFELAPKKTAEKILLLPRASRCATHAVRYLSGRGIDSELIDFCLATGRLYESGGKYHNVVFWARTGTEKPGTPISGALAPILRVSVTAATSVFHLISPLNTATPFTCLRAPSTCFPMLPCKKCTAWTGKRIICCHWPACISRKKKLKKARCRWR